ncbi:Autophagy-related protein 101 [Plasmodiophora brassicae]
MNLQKFSMEAIEMEKFRVRTVLRALVHTILFNRALGPIRIRDVECEGIQMRFTAIDDERIVESVERKIEATYAALERDGQGTVTLSFYEKRPVKTLFFATRDEKIIWEQWCIPVAVRERAMGGAEPVDIEDQLRARLMFIVRTVNDARDHLPPIPPDVPMYPVEFTYASSGAGASPSESWSVSIRRMLREGPPKFT